MLIIGNHTPTRITYNNSNIAIFPDWSFAGNATYLPLIIEYLISYSQITNHLPSVRCRNRRIERHSLPMPWRQRHQNPPPTTGDRQRNNVRNQNQIPVCYPGAITQNRRESVRQQLPRIRREMINYTIITHQCRIWTPQPLPLRRRRVRQLLAHQLRTFQAGTPPHPISLVPLHLRLRPPDVG